MQKVEISKSTEDALRLLGVTFDATRDEMRDAYHRRMKEVHPDATHQAETSEARDKITKITDAHTLLMGELFGQHKGQKRSGHYHLYLDINEISSGTIIYNPVVSCDDCNGTGFLRPEKCEKCHGDGHIDVVSDTADGKRVRSVMCPLCYGKGEMKVTCRSCSGGRRRLSGKLVIPSGSRPGDALKLDAFTIIIGCKKAGGVSFEGGVYTMDHLVPFSRMVLGGKVNVLGPSGSEVTLTIPENCKPGRKFTIRGEGAITQDKKRGDLCVRVGVKMPTQSQSRNYIVRIALKILQKNGL